MPVRDFLANESGDLAVVNGDFAVVGDSARVSPALAAWLAVHFPGYTSEQLAVRQSIKIRVQFFLGEYFLDESVGVPWVEQILIKSPDPLVVRELLREAIADAPDVTEVVGVELLQVDADRKATIAYEVRTTYTTAPVTGEAPAP